MLENFLPKLWGNINALGATLIFPLFTLLFYFIHKNFRKFTLLSISAAMLGAFLILPNFSKWYKLLFIIYFSGGLLILIRMIIVLRDSFFYKNIENKFLSIWFLLFFLAIVIIMPLGTARYLLPCLLPIVVVMIKDLESYTRNWEKAGIAAVVVTLCFAIFTSAGDYKFAEANKKFAEDFSKKYTNNNVWYSGEFGFGWYMERKGFKYLLLDNNLHKGAIIVIPSYSWPIVRNDLKTKMQLIDTFTYNTKIPVRLINHSINAGFYVHYDGILPFVFSTKNLEKFSIYKVN